MNWFRTVRFWFRGLLRKENSDVRMDEEMRSHIEMQTQENMERGMKQEEARYAALRQFGSNQYPFAHIRGVAGNYFQTLRVPLLEGRHFTDADNETARKVVLINATMARQFWAQESAVGKRLRPDALQDPAPRVFSLFCWEFLQGWPCFSRRPGFTACFAARLANAHARLEFEWRSEPGQEVFML
jgi:hypothetical protein